MTNTTQPEALRLAELLTADEWPGHMTLVSYARECVAELRRQHTELETLRAKLKTYEDLGDAADDMQLLRAGYAAAPTTQPAPQQEPSYISVQLAEMVLSDCGHSSNYTPLLDRVAARIDAHVERRLDEFRSCLEYKPTPQPSPAAQGDALDVARYRYLRDVPMDQWPAELLTAIRLQQNAKWDAAIDAARKQGANHD